MLTYTLVPDIDEPNFSPDSGFFKILMKFPAEYAALYCSTEYKNKYADSVKKLEERGVKVVLDTWEGLGPDKVVPILNRTKVFPTSNALQAKMTGVRFLIYCGEVEKVYSTPALDERYLYATETQMLTSIIDGRFATDENGIPEVGINERGGQAAVAGFLEREDLLEGRGEDKTELKMKLAEYLNTDFDSKKLLVALYYSDHLDTKALNDAISCLSSEVTVLLTGDTDKAVDLENNGNIVICPDDSPEIRTLLRYGTDVVLADVLSRDFIMAVALGLKTIPLYSMDYFAGPERVRTDFSRELAEYEHLIAVRISEVITALDISRPAEIMTRLQDADYWSSYEENIKQVQFYSFGRYMFGDAAADRALTLIMRYIQHFNLATLESLQGNKPTAPIRRNMPVPKL